LIASAKTLCVDPRHERACRDKEPVYSLRGKKAMAIETEGAHAAWKATLAQAFSRKAGARDYRV
jgi:hypothetical protein